MDFPRAHPYDHCIMMSLPNLLTLSRILVIPALIALMFLESAAARWSALVLFSAAGITDYFDGYLARAKEQVSALGRFLDPIADKLLVASVLLMLAAFQRIDSYSLLPALVILCREIFVSGLREFLAEIHVSVPVSKLAKWKTTVQMLALGFLIIGDAGPAQIPVAKIGEVALWLAAVLTLITGYDYLRTGLHHMRRHDQS